MCGEQLAFFWCQMMKVFLRHSSEGILSERVALRPAARQKLNHPGIGAGVDFML